MSCVKSQKHAFQSLYFELDYALQLFFSCMCLLKLNLEITNVFHKSGHQHVRTVHCSAKQKTHIY
jgi:hypothetical protein